MMKKILGVLGLAAVATTAAAQSNVTIYGIIDAGLVRESGGAAGSVTKLGSGVQNGSRLGFRGVEDLGGALSAIYVLESGFNIDTGVSGQGGLLFGRQAFVGLKSKDLGTITAGRQYTPLYMGLSAVDPFLGAATAASGANMLAEGGLRMNNTVKYALPVVNGFSGEVAYGFGETATDSSAGRNLGALLTYATGPLALQLAHHQANTIPTGTVPQANGKTTFVGGSYKVGTATASLGYAINKGMVVINSSARPNTDSRDVLLGLTLPFGSASTFLASVILKDDRSALNADARQMGIAYYYALSKRTNLYAAYARINNDGALGTKDFFTVGNGSDTGTGNRGLNLGVRHVF
jgi:predicted porin